MRRIIFALCFALLITLNLHAQEAQLTGLVSDSSSAVIPGASVSLRNEATGVKYQNQSNGAGVYNFPFVKPGVYEITVEKTGFKTLNRTGVKIDVSQSARIDFTLQIGQTTQVVEVRASAPLVNTSDGTVSDIVTGKQIVDLNLNGRNYTSLLILVPGAIPDNSFDPNTAGGLSIPTVYFNGIRTQENTYTIDDSDTTDDSGGGWAPVYTPDVDSIAEFRITTSNYGADLGKRSGAVIQLATKSGTKNFHGAAFEFVRNDALNANPWFVNRQLWSGLSPQDCGGNPAGPCNAPIAPLKQNDFGFDIGGPFYIPGHYNTDKSKTFFFFSESWARYRTGTVLSSNVPTARMRSGDFSECDPKSANFNSVAASNCTLPINQATGLPFQNDIVPINPNAQAMLSSLVPLANNGIDGWTDAPMIASNSRQDSLRVDQNISDKTALFVHLVQESWAEDDVPVLWSSSVFDTIKSHHELPAKNVALHLIQNFKPDLMNEFILTFVNDIQSVTDSVGPGSPSGSINKPSTWTGGTIFSPNQKLAVLPGVTVCGGTPFCFTEDPDIWGAPKSGNFSASFSVSDKLVYTVNKHTLRMGIDILDHHADSELVGTDPEGNYSFRAKSPTSTGNALADMYSGIIDSYAEGTFVAGGVPIGGLGWARERRHTFEPFIQDDWKVSRRLTLNLGLRYYYFTPQHDVSTPSSDADFFPQLYNSAQQAQININGNIVPGTGFNYTEFGNGLVHCGVGGVPAGCRNMPGSMFAPRFGFAIDPTGSGKTSIRGGWGIFYDLGRGEGQAFDAGGNPPATYSATGYNIVGYQNIAPGPLPTGSVSVWPENGPWMQDQQFNVTVQHEFSGNNIVSLGWVGSLGRHLTRAQNWNQVPDGLGTVNVPVLAGTAGCDASGNCNAQSILINREEPSIYFVPYRGYSSIEAQEFAGSSHYNGLQISYRHAASHGVTYQLAYTYSNSMDNSSNYNTEYGVDDTDLNRWWSKSGFNRTQALVASYIWDMPFFKNNTNRFVKAGLGGWQFSGISTFFSGLPVDFNCGATGLSSGIGGGMRCNTLGPLKIQKGSYNDPTYGPTPTWFNPADLGQPLASQYYANGEPGMFGYLGRNVLTGPGRNNWDLGLHKNFQTPWFGGERSTLQVRFETYNTFNHPQWNSINASCGGNTPAGAPCSGSANNLGNGEVNGAWSPRSLQLGMKLTF